MSSLVTFFASYIHRPIYIKRNPMGIKQTIIPISKFFGSPHSAYELMSSVSWKYLK